MYALVTGASSGIGLEYARALARRGYDLVIVSNEDAIATRAQELHQQFPTCTVLPLVMDLGRQEAAQELHQWCQERALTVEVLVNNAGVYHDRDFLEDSVEFTHLILNLHMHTPALLTHYFGRDMVARGKGYILNMSSVTSDYGIQRMSTYASTKSFLRRFSRSVHIELRYRGVHVTCVRPGAVATTLYNIPSRYVRMGLAVGAIIRPEALAERGLRALFRGQCETTPGFFTQILNLVPLLPTWLLRLIRRWHLF